MAAYDRLDQNGRYIEGFNIVGDKKGGILQRSSSAGRMSWWGDWIVLLMCMNGRIEWLCVTSTDIVLREVKSWMKSLKRATRMFFTADCPMGVWVWVWLSLTDCVCCMCLSAFLCKYVGVCESNCLSLWLCFCMSVGFCLCVSHSVSVSVCVCVSVCVFVNVSYCHLLTPSMLGWSRSWSV